MPQKIYPRSRDRATIYLKSVISNPNIIVDDYTMYNDFVREPREFEKNNVLYQNKMVELAGRTYPAAYNQDTVRKYRIFALNCRTTEKEKSRRTAIITHARRYFMDGFEIQRRLFHYVDKEAETGSIAWLSDVRNAF